jgi:phage shock protein A
MSKRGIIGRVAQLAHTNVGAVIDAAENPWQAVDQLTTAYSTAIAEAERAIADLADDRRVTTDDQREDAAAAELWAAAAAATSQAADELRAAGDAAAAERFDNLARIALARELVADNDIETSQHTIAAQTMSVETLTSGLGQMQMKLTELTERRKLLTGGPGGAQAQQAQQPHGGRVIKNVDVMDPAGEVALFEELVRLEESWLHGGAAQARPPGTQAGGFVSQDSNAARDTEIEERLQSVKMARAMASALARANDQPLR